MSRFTRLVSFPVLAALSLALGGCLKAPPPPGVTQLQFYLAAWGTDDQRLMQAMATAFEAENPDIKVNFIIINPTAYNERMQTLMVGGIVPDIMSVDINVYYEWADRGLLADVTDLMNDAAREQKMTFMPIVPEQLGYHGRYYGVPYSMCGVILQMNLDIFRQGGVPIPPVKDITWDWIAQVAPKLSRRGGNPNAPAEFFFSMPDMASLLFTFGAKIFDDPSNPHQILVDSPQAEAMCRYVRRLAATKSVLTRAEATNSSNLALEGLFALGKTAARIHGLWDRPGLYGVPAGFDWDVRPFPAGPTGRRVTADGAYIVGFPPNSAHPEAARRFLRFLLTPKGIAIACSTGQFMPLFRELLNDPAVMPPGDPASRHYYFDTMESGMSQLPVHGPGVMQLRRIIDSRLDQVSAEPNTPIPVILQTLKAEIARWLEDEKRNGFYADAHEKAH